MRDDGKAAPRGGLRRLVLAALLGLVALVLAFIGAVEMGLDDDYCFSGDPDIPRQPGGSAHSRLNLWPPGTTCIFQDGVGVVVVEPPIEGFLLFVAGAAVGLLSLWQLVGATRRLDRIGGAEIPAAISLVSSSIAILLTMAWAPLFAVPFAAVGAILALQRRVRSNRVLRFLCVAMAALAVVLTVYGLVSPPWLRGMVRR